VTYDILRYINTLTYLLTYLILLSAVHQGVTVQGTQDVTTTSSYVERHDDGDGEFWRVLAFSRRRLAYKSTRRHATPRDAATNCFVKRCDIAAVQRRRPRLLLLLLLCGVDADDCLMD